MFPPKTIGIVGINGRMATHVVAPFFRDAGYEVIGSDITDQNGLTNEEVVLRADVVYFSILPIAAVAEAMSGLIPHSRPGTLWLHGTSVQNPVGQPIEPLLRDLRDNEKVTAGFLHFMVGPTVRSLRGQSAMYGFVDSLHGSGQESEWEHWLTGLLKERRLRYFKKTPQEHDALTKVSQVVPMLTSLLTGLLWSKSEVPPGEALHVAGPPCWLQAFGALRSLSQGAVTSEILANHPETLGALADIQASIEFIRVACGTKDIKRLQAISEAGLATFPVVESLEIKRHTDWHIRLEGDIRDGAICFLFSAAENWLGLLTDVLEVLDQFKLSKTSCMAQEEPTGGCRFYIGLKDADSSLAKDAAREVIRLYGGTLKSAGS